MSSLPSATPASRELVRFRRIRMLALPIRLGAILLVVLLLAATGVLR